VFAVHGVGGILGMVFVGIFATLSVNPAGADGLLYGSAALLVKQLIGIVTIGAYAFAVTWGLGKLVDKTIGLRVSAAEEAVGLDLSQHGERAYGGLLR
jgi:Amt family ammonium transporter